MIGTLYVVSAPSGGGKTSLVRALSQREPGMVVSVSHTTRRRRPSERDGVDYHFVETATFKRMAAAGEFLEYARVYDQYYATAQVGVEQELARGRDVLLDIDWQGARQVRSAIADTVSVFILPPSRTELERRLRGRGQDSDAVIAERMQVAVEEMSHYDEYDYLVINDHFEQALADLCAIVHAWRLRRTAQARPWARVLSELLRGDNPRSRL
ncbi:MAG: guanylate kinase [Nitrococcus sp.]|nr:guanylate kinase [Nitrococcus sp.]